MVAALESELPREVAMPVPELESPQEVEEPTKGQEVVVVVPGTNSAVQGSAARHALF